MSGPPWGAWTGRRTYTFPMVRRLALVLGREAAEDRRLAEAVRALEGRGFELERRVISDDAPAEALARAAAEAGREAVVACGGDGTLHEVARGVLAAGAPCAVGVVPFGTGNDFAGAAGVPDAPAEALELVAARDPVPIDVGVCDGRAFVNVASGGFPAQITSEVDSGVKSLLGRFSYALTGLARVTGERSGEPVRLRWPDGDWEGPLFGFAVGNGRRAGGGFQVCPRALLDDGLLDVLLLPEAPDRSLLELFLDHRRLVADAEADVLRYLQVPWLELESRASSRLQVNLDGEPVQGDRFRFEVRPRALPFHLPDRAPLSQRGVSGP